MLGLILVSGMAVVGCRSEVSKDSAVDPVDTGADTGGTDGSSEAFAELWLQSRRENGPRLELLC